jgi:hypothetical protein
MMYYLISQCFCKSFKTSILTILVPCKLVDYRYRRLIVVASGHYVVCASNITFVTYDCSGKCPSDEYASESDSSFSSSMVHSAHFYFFSHPSILKVTKLFTNLVVYLNLMQCPTYTYYCCDRKQTQLLSGGWINIKHTSCTNPCDGRKFPFGPILCILV